MTLETYMQDRRTVVFWLQRGRIQCRTTGPVWIEMLTVDSVEKCHSEVFNSYQEWWIYIYNSIILCVKLKWIAGLRRREMNNKWWLNKATTTTTKNHEYLLWFSSFVCLLLFFSVRFTIRNDIVMVGFLRSALFFVAIFNLSMALRFFSRNNL